MNPITHALAGWLVANAAVLDRRDRWIVTAASVAPDVDGLGLVVDFATHSGSSPTQWFAEYHHVLTHNLLFALLVGGASLVLAKRRGVTVFLVLLVFHLHLLGDLVGARGPAPEGYQWPILYLWPVSDAVAWTWGGQWELNAWPNFLVTTAALSLTIFLAWKRGYSPLEMISRKADGAFVTTLRSRFGDHHP
jgi:inner membrane protein